jgi:PAS domain S-box-containing protein
MSTSESQNHSPLELRPFADRFPAIAWSALPDGSLDFINQRFRGYTGLSPDQLYGSEWKSTIHRDDLQRLENWLQNLLQSQRLVQRKFAFTASNGEYRWFQVAAAPVYDEQDNLVRWYGSIPT